MADTFENRWKASCVTTKEKEREYWRIIESGEVRLLSFPPPLFSLFHIMIYVVYLNLLIWDVGVGSRAVRLRFGRWQARLRLPLESLCQGAWSRHSRPPLAP
jgi:hypothetical protein